MSEETSVRAHKRDAVLEPICGHILANGLEASNLRALAKVAGTSDRMLLYYFADKDDLIEAALDRLGERLAAALEQGTPASPSPPDELTEALWSACRRPPVWPYVVLFIELAIRAERSGEPFVSSARAISDRFRSWIADHLEGGSREWRTAEAERILTIIDGRALLRLTNASR